MKVLVVVDLQNDFINGALGSEAAEKIVPNVCARIKSYTNEGMIFFTRDEHGADYEDTLEGRAFPEHCIKDTEGFQLDPRVKDLVIPDSETMTVFCKSSFGCFGIANDLLIQEEATGDKVTSIEIVGLCTDLCVLANAIILRTAFPDVPMYIPSDCCAGSTPEMHEIALKVLNGMLCNTDEAFI